MTNYKIIQQRNIWLSISTILFVIFGSALLVWGLKYGIDFTGGSLLEVKFLTASPTVSEVETKLASLNLGSLIVQSVDEKGFIVRFQETSEEKHQAVLAKLNELTQSKDKGLVVEVSKDKKVAVDKTKEKTSDGIEELRFDSVGPSIGEELKVKSIYAIIFVLLAILFYITYVFRKVSKPVASWKYGTAALIALAHDTIITLGVFAIFGKFLGVEINASFIAAILTVLGYSVHDTIVVFDRLRENLPKSREDFEGTVNISLNQTLARSINTSLTVLLVLAPMIIFGGSSIRVFVSVLAIGIFIGTYSSIFVASPILVIWEKWKK
ncbi:protein translocase subunit SecF [Patescibacteria group bacterium]|nr:protein translocase subunit SecF [Patescibacteria group bacterium]MBU0879821.1 protein translocase subunit SecF [Patescibacteria group bacterium]MBU0880236.1 protein translocase subunit SecF [Patescibacteria group bacterium]MBU0898093.1 protein translocase subunit SecF [Patescibacteria group bacterium]MBU1783359.1 protein translocase subunit SecF [Patescibacteria group bacterium]